MDFYPGLFPNVRADNTLFKMCLFWSEWFPCNSRMAKSKLEYEQDVANLWKSRELYLHLLHATVVERQSFYCSEAGAFPVCLFC